MSLTDSRLITSHISDEDTITNFILRAHVICQICHIVVTLRVTKIMNQPWCVWGGGGGWGDCHQGVKIVSCKQSIFIIAHS